MGLVGRRRSTALIGLVVLVAVAAGVRSGGAAAVAPSARWSGTFSPRLTMPAGSDGAGSWPMRNYHVYVPRQPAPVGTRALVVYLHGTSQTAIDAANGVLWNDLADEEGFIVAYPEEATPAESGSTSDGSSDARGWAWGRAVFESRGAGEMRTIAEITEAVTAAHGVDPGRVFIAGASAGAIMATVMAATYPDLYSAVGSWAGCSYLCADTTGDLGYQRMGERARVIPAILFAGTTDYLINPALTSMQVGGLVGMNDLADDGLPNSSVSRVPTAGPTTFGAEPASLAPGPEPSLTDNGCRAMVNKPNNPCPAGWLGWSKYPYTVTQFGYAADPSHVVVESWVIHLQNHNYGGGNPEGTFVDPYGPDTTRPAWAFFEAHAR